MFRMVHEPVKPVVGAQRPCFSKLVRSVSAAVPVDALMLLRVGSDLSLDVQDGPRTSQTRCRRPEAMLQQVGTVSFRSRASRCANAAQGRIRSQLVQSRAASRLACIVT